MCFFLNNREHNKANVLFFTRAHFLGLEQVCFPFGNKSSKGEMFSKNEIFYHNFFLLKQLSNSDPKFCIFGGGCHTIMFVGYNFRISLK
jgi:hypothetical protein